MEQAVILARRVKARAVLLHAGQVPVSCHQSGRKETVQLPQQFQQCRLLFRRPRVGVFSSSVQSAFVADADGAAVEATRVRPHFQQAPVAGHDTAPADIKMITHGTEAARLVVTQQLFRRIVAVTTGGRAMDDEEADRVRPAHHQPAFHPGQQVALVERLLPADRHGKRFLYHRRAD